jgi:sulfopyruvate decarboxylase subunit beta
MKRIEALRVIDNVYADRPLVVTCGATSRELAAVQISDRHLYLLDSMGLAGAVGVGLALAGHGPLAAIEGDGSLLMGSSILPSIAYLRPQGFTLIVLDNHQHASAGDFPTQSERVSLGDMCRAVGLTTYQCSTSADLASMLSAARGESVSAPAAVVVEIEPGNEKGVPFLLHDPVAIKTRFESTLTGES